MLARVFSCAVVGLDGVVVEVEVDTAGGLPKVIIVGLPDAAVQESRERVQAAVRNSGHPFPRKHVTVNLAPASVRKAGPAYDLPIAIGVLLATRFLPPGSVEDTMIVGELSLDGGLRHVRGVLPMAAKAREQGFKRLIVPAADAAEAALIPDLEIIPAGSLQAVIGHLRGLDLITCEPFVEPVITPAPGQADFAEIKGQEHVKRAMEVAAAGSHNVMMSGPPGAGKTLVARSLPGILPVMEIDEALDVTRIYSIADQLPAETPLLRRRPFRAPHHTISHAGLVGGGNVPQPGEISLAHRGVLFLNGTPRRPGPWHNFLCRPGRQSQQGGPPQHRPRPHPGGTVTYDLITIGGGAAGFFGALAAAEKHPDLRCIILERGPRPLAKVLVSGGGRCNVTHACFVPADLARQYPRGGQKLLEPFNRFQPADTIAWFETRGVKLKTEQDGRVFPVSDRAQTIVDCLLGEARHLGVEVRTLCAVQSVDCSPDGFIVRGGGFGSLTAAKVLLAPGGNAAPLYRSAAQLGHTIVPPLPSLFTFNITDPRIDGLQGLSVNACNVTLRCGGREFRADGPVLITHWGLSGPAVLKLSAWGARELAAAGYRARLEINWLDGLTPASAFKGLQQLRDEQPRAHLQSHNPFGRMPARLWRSLAHSAGAAEERTLAETSNQVLRRMADELTQGEFELVGKGVFKEEFVTCGGVALDEVNFETMESILQPGLFFAGEILDIDGLTGGFNFQSAWTTGWLAGQAIAG